MSLLIRLAEKEDGPFLYKLSYDHFFEILNAWAWDPVTREKLLQLQIDGQNASYRSMFPNAHHGIIMYEDRPIGRLLLAQQTAEPDIKKEKRNAGIGTWLLKSICMEADITRKPMRLHVQNNNRAKNLYERLGFHKLEDLDFFTLMERLPQ